MKVNVADVISSVYTGDDILVFWLYLDAFGNENRGRNNT